MKNKTCFGQVVCVFFNCILLLLACHAFCQCPDKGVIKSKVSFVYNSSSLDNEGKLKQLQDLHRQMTDCHFVNDSVFMYLLQKMGVLNFKLSNFSSGVHFTKASINIAKACFKNQATGNLSLVDGYNTLQYCYGTMNRLEEKFDAIDSCISYSLKGNTGFEKIRYVLADKVDHLFNKGEYSSCIRDATLGLNIIQKYYHGKDSIGFINSFTTPLMNALMFSKDFVTAEQFLNNQVRSFEQTKNTKYLGPDYSFLGIINRDRKNYAAALSYFKKAYHAFSSIGFKSGLAQSLVSMGMVYAKNLNLQETGLRYCAKALKYADPIDSLFILKETGNIYAQKGMFDKAQYFFQQAFNTIQPNINETGILQNSFAFPGFNILQSLLDLTIEKADAYLLQYYISKNISFFNTAISIYKKADLFLAKIKTDQQLELESNLVWRGSADSLYEHAIGACYTNRDFENAFYFFEKSRSILLNDQINEQRWMADEDIFKQAQLKKKLIELEINSSNSPASSTEYSSIQNQLYTARQDMDVLLRKIKNKTPLFYNDYIDTSFVTLQLLKENLLHHSKTMVELYAGETAVYVLTITPQNQSFIKINRQLYDSITTVFHDFISHPDLLNKDFTGFVKTAQYLYRLIFQNNIPPYGSIVISPDGKIFPFEALVTNENTRQPIFFLANYATSYTYSAKYLTNLFALSNKKIRILGIAPVQYKNHPVMANLIGSDISLKRIKNYFSDVTNLTHEDASKSNFLQHFYDYNIIQLYTHATASSSKNNPVIFFSDSALYLAELITGRRPVTQLVVLSACETAKGKLYKGEGVFSFNRGFAALGIPAAISNLWSVDNESTYRITELFYKYLSQGLPTDVALQKAKLEFINNSSSKEKKLPYFWAGSILTGKVDIIKGKPGFAWRGLVAGGIFLLGIAYFTIKIMQRNKKRANAIS